MLQSPVDVSKIFTASKLRTSVSQARNKQTELSGERKLSWPPILT
jgi:hypothetical protein